MSDVSALCPNCNHRMSVINNDILGIIADYNWFCTECETERPYSYNKTRPQEDAKDKRIKELEYELKWLLRVAVFNLPKHSTDIHIDGIKRNSFDIVSTAKQALEGKE